ncbi:MAG: efflux RND transporter periplasmic adaptor subunit [Gammaproteobacteria bacterium]|nr:efflux RND transporter periplasmic adaptor subunit [Gammaproteobacteria bacterium]
MHRFASLAGAALVLLLAACSGDPETRNVQEPGLSVTTAQLRATTMDRALVVSGSVAAWQEMTLGVELSGIRAAEVLVEVGDRVRAGSPLLRLDARTLTVQARQAEASVAQARANLDLARANVARGEQLVTQGLISSSDIDQLRAELASAEAQLITAQADRDAARLRLEFTTLRAPDDGVISARSVQPGQVVSAGEELLRMIRRGRLEWRAELAEADLSRVPVDALVELADPQGKRILGRVRAVSPAVDPATRTGLLYADLPEPGDLRAGMFAEGRVLLDRAEVGVLPRDAVVFRDGIPYVFVAGSPADTDAAVFNVAQRRVVIGSQQDDQIEIRDGVAAADRVVAQGAGFLSDGDLVREVSAHAAAAPRPDASQATP